MQHRGESLARIVSALLTLGMVACLALFAMSGKLTAVMVAPYLVAVAACAVFATPWPWRGISRARFYALLGVLWTSVTLTAWIEDQIVMATLYGVAAALSFWASLITLSLRNGTQAGRVQQAK